MQEGSQSIGEQINNSHLQNLRGLQEEALNSIFISTALAGLGFIYLTIHRLELWYLGLWGIGLIILPFVLNKISDHHFLVRAWFFVAGWILVILNLILAFPSNLSESFLVLPVLLASLVIHPWAGLAIIAANLVCLLGASVISQKVLVEDWLLFAGLQIGVWVLSWLALRPILSALHWSWQQYLLARQELMTARDAQAELKQAVKDLANASVQMNRLNQLLDSARRRAEEAERAKTEFVANVSHELRTPLNMVIGFSEIMLNSGNAYGKIPKALRADLAVILRNSQHLSALIDDVLDLSQIETGRMALTKELVNLREVVDSATVAIKPLFETKHLYLHVEMPDNLQIIGDRTRIREVLLNLLSNAGRFVEKGGVTIRFVVDQENIVCSVADTGPGIAPEDQARLFQPFQQADGTIRRRFGGSGLGLSISKHFVELHGGRMWLESELGRGTTIFFSLPFQSPSLRTESFSRWLNPDWEYRQRTRKWSAPKLEIKPRLLVVEKAGQLSKMLHRYLGDVEIVTRSELNGVAEELARSPVQAMILNQPQIDQTIEQIWRQNILPAGVPAIVCYLPGDEEEARQLGVDRYLIKPISREEIMITLDQLGIKAGTLLIVDDEKDMIQLLWRMITSISRGFRVISANDGSEAIAMMGIEKPDAIFLDLSMPNMDGFQFLAHRRENPEWQKIPVIIMSARDPAGHPIIASSIGITRGGGLNMPQFLSVVSFISGLISEGEGKGNPESQSAFVEKPVSLETPLRQ